MTRLIIKGILFLLISVSLGITSFSQSTTIPVFSPSGGFRIDGYLQRQGEAGDWFAGPGGSATGSFIFDDAGNSFALHYIDRWNDDSDNVFFKGRFGDDPSTMKWTLKKSQAKGDINHTMGFLTVGNGVWLILAGDRLSSNNTSYLDFELMQKAVVRVGNSDNGGFYSFGRDGGRTVGDLNISVKFDKHATDNNIKVYEWQRTNSISGFGYVQINVPSIIFSAINTKPVNVPFGAFGSTVYPPFSFAELAINIGVVSGGNCSNAGETRTVWMQSKSDDSYNANLIDFAETTQLPINPNYSVSVDYLFYDLQHAQLTANVLPGPVDDYNFFWLPITPLTGFLSNPNIFNPVFSAGSNDYCLSYIYELYVYKKSDGCLVSITPVVINAPCKIGKPINPDQMHHSEILAEENSNTEDLINVFPNPARSTSTITLGRNNGSKDVHLINMNGSIVQRWSSITTNTLQLKDLPSGIYLLKVFSRTTGKTETKKIIVNN